MSRKRYDICIATAGVQYLIYDRYYPHFSNLCKLPNEHGHLRPLRFASYRDAQAWLDRMDADTRSPAQEYRELAEQAARVQLNM